MKFLILLMSVFLFSACSHMHGKSDKNCCGKAGKGMHEKMLIEMDADKDGKLSEDEFSKAHAAMFEKMDTNKDGAVTQDEMGGFHKSKRKGHCGDCKHKKCDHKDECKKDDACKHKGTCHT